MKQAWEAHALEGPTETSKDDNGKSDVIFDKAENNFLVHKATINETNIITE